METHFAAEGTPLTSVAIHTDIGIGAGARFVANGAGIRGVAGLNAAVWIEDRTAEVCIDDFEDTSVVEAYGQITEVCSKWGRVTTKNTTNH